MLSNPQWARPLLQSRNQGRTHHGKLEQVFCGAVHIRTQIQHRGGASLGVGQLRGDGWAINAIQRLQQITGNGHQSARVASRYRGGGSAILDLLDGYAHGRIFLLAQGHFHGVVHGDNLRGSHDGGTVVRERLKALRQAHQQQTRLGMGF